MEIQGGRLLVGLGNPGSRYDWTPHNLGFHVLDHLAARKGWIFESATRLEPDHGLRQLTFARAGTHGLLVKPQTFMNLSGQVVAPLARMLGLGPESILVVYDDLDLALGELRIRPHGGSGGHNGMKSIAEALGTDRFPRLRVGIGRPRTDAARHVLEPFSAEGKVEAEISVAQASDFCLDWIQGEELDRAMTRYHSRWNQDAV
jgi:peptidyl-tRNA hydrolase, PTH1 family